MDWGYLFALLTAVITVGLPTIYSLSTRNIRLEQIKQIDEILSKNSLIGEDLVNLKLTRSALIFLQHGSVINRRMAPVLIFFAAYLTSVYLLLLSMGSYLDHQGIDSFKVVLEWFPWILLAIGSLAFSMLFYQVKLKENRELRRYLEDREKYYRKSKRK